MIELEQRISVTEVEVERRRLVDFDQRHEQQIGLTEVAKSDIRRRRARRAKCGGKTTTRAADRRCHDDRSLLDDLRVLQPDDGDCGAETARQGSRAAR